MSKDEHKVVRTLDDLKDGLKARKKAPDRDYLRRKYPHAFREVTDPRTGRVEWRVGGTDSTGRPYLTPEQQREFNASFRPFMAAETERGAKIKARRPEPVPLRDRDGSVRYITPHRADSVARARGWSAAYRFRAINPIERGEGGMLWKLVAGRWHPLGVKCLGTPLYGEREARGLQYDPDGAPWRLIGDEWRAL